MNGVINRLFILPKYILYCIIIYYIVRMSARLNMNPIRYESWKGKTLNQVVSFVQKNTDRFVENTTHNFFRARPLKHYRRELLVDPSYNHTHNPRISSTIRELEAPNGYVISVAERCGNGLEHTIDMTLPQNRYDNGLSTDANICMEQNARRRVRSSGMAKKRFDPMRGDALVYYNDNKQYLTSRNKTFQQNHFYTLRQGDPSILTEFAAKTNIYTAMGLNSCPKTLIVKDGNNNYFSYSWITDTYSTDPEDETKRVPDDIYEITFETGYYNIEEFNTRLQKEMERHNHYLINRITRTKIFLIKMIYNNYHDRLELQLYPFSTTIYPEADYLVPRVNQVDAWTRPEYPTIPSVRFYDNAISYATGISPGYYPDLTPWLNDASNPALISIRRNTPAAFLSTNQHHLFPFYTVVNYKPSNVNYGQQGAVSASTRTLQEKYTTITRNGSIFAVSYGLEVSNAVSYGVPENINVIKEKLGYPLRRTPVFPKYSEDVAKIQCSSRKNMYFG